MGGDARGEAAVEFVVAASDNDVIGRGNTLPWRLPADLRRFKAITLGHGVLMGRKTFESIGRPLPGRRNIVLTRSARLAAPGCIVAAGMDEALAAAGAGGAAAADDAPLMVLGGAEVYRLFLPLARRIHLTIVHTHIADGDTWFDEWRGGEWREAARERHEADAQNPIAHSFVTLERRR